MKTYKIEHWEALHNATETTLQGATINRVKNLLKEWHRNWGSLLAAHPNIDGEVQLTEKGHKLAMVFNGKTEETWRILPE